MQINKYKNKFKKTLELQPGGATQTTDDGGSWLAESEIDKSGTLLKIKTSINKNKQV